MAHELTSTDYMVSANAKTPWHGLGTVLPGNLTADEALKAAKLDWQVTQEPVFDGDMKQIQGYQVNKRSDTRDVLGMVSDGWTPVQNARVLEIAEALAQVDGEEFRPVVETAGSLRGGRIVWALVRLGERTFADSVHRSYLLLSNGHDGLRALRGTLTDVRVVCANTLRWAETASAGLYVSHAKGVEARVNAALETLGWANDATRSTFAIYEALACTAVSLDTANAGFRRLCIDDQDAPTPAELRAVDSMTELFRHGRGNTGKTAFDFLNAATDWADHVKTYRESDGMDERRFLGSNLGGEADHLKTAAFRFSKSLVTA